MRSSRREERPSQFRAVPETIAHVKSDSIAIAMQIAPSVAIWSVTWPLERSTNCGSTAVKMMMPLGLVAPTKNPSR